MTHPTDILCIGSVLWDVIGRSRAVMRQGSDVPGRITRLAGGVAMNIAMTARRFDLHPVLLTAIGKDEAGDALIAYADRIGIETAHVYRSDDLPTDRYMAIEGANGLIAAIADAHSLEEAGDKILTPLADGTLGSTDAPYAGLVALDGNLTETLLADIAESPLFGAADLRIAPASPGKAERLLPFLAAGRGTLYVNLEEANLLLQAAHDNAPDAAAALIGRGAARALVTDGGGTAAAASPDGVLTATPPQVLVTRVTGAGDTFMAAHIASETNGKTPQAALEAALTSAAAYVSGDRPT
ncbi:MAG: PfkB family carbohydrate kinase [Pseudomonadota bacterium]